MSEDERPVRRRRIAGEGAPSAGGTQQPARRVVKRPVARPGAAKASSTAEEAPQTPEVEVEEVESPDVDHHDVQDDAVEVEDDTVEGDTDEHDEDEDDDRGPRIIPAAWRPGRLRSKDKGTDKAEPAAAQEPTVEEATSSRARLHTVLGVLVVVLALVFAVGGSYWAAQRVMGASGVTAAHAEGASAASTASERILSYRYDRLEEHLEEAQALMTDDFAEEFESLSPALGDLAPQREIVVEATARDAAPMPCGGDCSRDAVEVLVFIDQARTADGEEEPTVFGNRIALSMVKTGGDWLVDGIEAY